jgi:hypothetical protein
MRGISRWALRCSLPAVAVGLLAGCDPVEQPQEPAVVVLVTVDTLQPQSYRARLALATVLASRSASAAAAEQFRRALELNPAGLHARRGLEAVQ